MIERETRPEDPQQPLGGELARALPGLARIAVGAGWRTAGWTARNWGKLGGRVARATTSPREALALGDDARTLTVRTLRAAAALLDAGESGDWTPTQPGGAPSPAPADRPDAGVRSSPPQDDPDHPAYALRDRGRELLERSRDVNDVDDAHPAYERILDELAPDEARILLLLLLEGPQPAVDVRTGGPIGLVKSKLIALGLNMIGAKAGLRYVDRVPAYLNNLFRLGLIWFSRETLSDMSRYQLLEAQPDVLAASKSVAYARVVRRSIHLTPFGEDFCMTCLTPESSKLDQLPAHSSPPTRVGPTGEPEPEAMPYPER